MKRQVVVLVSALFLAACAGGGAATQPTGSPTGQTTTPPPEDECPAQTTLVMNSRTFDPSCLEVARGDTLSIENASGVRHSFTLDKPKVDFDVQTEESAQYDVDLKKKEYRFYCKYHGGMFVDVVVT